jgi:sugar/nucleoside kinase (ribokinase family)
MIDYLAIGHVAKDLTAEGPLLGGTVSYAGRTAQSIGLRVGVITSCEEDFDLSPLHGIHVFRWPSTSTTTFENIYTQDGRIQRLHSRAMELKLDSVPLEWRDARIVHLGPIAREVDPDIAQLFASAFIGISPQGWMRRWNHSNHIHPLKWKTIKSYLPLSDAVVLSIEDLQNDEAAAREMARYCHVLAVTRAAQGARIFYHGQSLDLPAPEVEEVDSTGAGDIFAAAFFIRLQETNDPHEAGVFANIVASTSITRRGVSSTPTGEEMEAAFSRARQ